MTVQVFSSAPLDHETEQMVRDFVTKKHGHCTINFQVDPSLGLGIKIVAQDNEYQMNLAAELEHIFNQIRQ